MNGDSGTAQTVIDYCPDVYYCSVDDIPGGDVTEWEHLGTAEADGTIVLDTTDLEPGEYIVAMAGQYGVEYKDSICSTPGGIRITVNEKGEAVVIPGDFDGNGEFDMQDLTKAFSAFTDEVILTDAQAAVIDTNKNGIVVDTKNHQNIPTVYQSGELF